MSDQRQLCARRRRRQARDRTTAEQDMMSVQILAAALRCVQSGTQADGATGGGGPVATGIPAKVSTSSLARLQGLLPTPTSPALLRAGERALAEQFAAQLSQPQYVDGLPRPSGSRSARFLLLITRFYAHQHRPGRARIQYERSEVGLDLAALRDRVLPAAPVADTPQQRHVHRRTVRRTTGRRRRTPRQSITGRALRPRRRGGRREDVLDAPPPVTRRDQATPSRGNG